MSVFEQTLKAVAPPDVVAALDKRLAESALAQQNERDKETYRSVRERFMDPAIAQICSDAQSNGYFAEDRYQCSGMWLIPVAHSAEFVAKDYAPQSDDLDFHFRIPLDLCLFRIEFCCVPATAEAPAMVECHWQRRAGRLDRLTKSRPNGGFFDYGGAFHYNSPEFVARDSESASVPAQTRTRLSEVAAGGKQFFDKALSDFLTHALRTAQAESLQLPTPPAYVRSKHPARTPVRTFLKGLVGLS